MLKNYIKVGLRNIRKNAGFSLINLMGLAIGLACSVLILLYIFHEFSYDKNHVNADRIYRVTQTLHTETATEDGAGTPFPLAPTLVQEFPGQIEQAVRLFNMQTPKLSIGKQEELIFFKEPHFFFADSTIFDIFSFEFIEGDASTALDKPNTMVLTEEMAKKYFGDESAIGETLFFEGRMNLEITGIIKSLPETSHFKADFLASFSSLRNFYRGAFDTSWFWNPVYTYVLLSPNTKPSFFEQNYESFYERHIKEQIPATNRVDMQLQPLTSIHLHSRLDQELRINGNIQYIYIFSIIAFILLAVACVNFMNLSTALSIKRAREVGLRKSMGAERAVLFGQFMGESFLLTFFAFVVAMALVYLALPMFNSVLSVELKPGYLLQPVILGSLFILLFVISAASGFYPALYLSSFDPIETLRGTFKSSGNTLLRKVLVTLQFGMSAFLIAGTLIVFFQLKHLQNRDLGFNEARILIIPTTLTGTIWEYAAFKERVLLNPSIQYVTGVHTVLGGTNNVQYKYKVEGHPEELTIPGIFVMYDFFETYDIKLLAGRAFSEEYGSDRTESIIVNQKFVEAFGLGTPEQAIGKQITAEDKAHTIIGVTDNFHHTSLKRELEPLVIDMPNEEFDIVYRISYIAIKTFGGNMSEISAFLADVWAEFDRSHPFEYELHEANLEKIYRPEREMGNMAAIFSVICIVIACLGLFGLLSYVAESRKKEIGIRKTLGASIGSLLWLLCKDFLYIILIANTIIWPLVYTISENWLQEFPYRIVFPFELIPMVAVLSLIIAFLSIVPLAARAAYVPPADVLKAD